jgi:hypothetical protein
MTIKQIADLLRAVADKLDPPNNAPEPPAPPALIPVRVLARAMARMEGADVAGSVNQRLIREHGRYNQGHLMFAKQRGAIGVFIRDRDWAAWPTEEEGWQGLMRQIRLDAGRGHTLESFVAKFAPSSENNTARYVANVAAWTGIDPQAKLSAVLDFSDVA